ncbi:MAG: ECF-type sigma factor [bacterium]|nr:ECF-type sigma factor [bacterium]
MSSSSSPSPRPPLTGILEQVAAGESGAVDQLFSAVYDELKVLARNNLARLRPGQTLQATALVHEAWIKLGGNSQAWDDRAHFFGAAARAMRNVLVDAARAKLREKRGGGQRPEELHTGIGVTDGPTVDVLALEEALQDLEAAHERPARVVMLRYFTGLEFEDIATMLGVSARSIRRDWLFARTWLQRALRDTD